MSSTSEFFKGLLKKGAEAAKDMAVESTKSAVKSTAKSAWEGIKSGTSPRDGGPGLISTVSDASKRIKTKVSEYKSSVPQPQVPIQGQYLPEPNQEVSAEQPQSNTPTVVSYKEIPSVTLKSDKKEAIEEFKRHNQEVERLIALDIDTDEKLGRDKYGADILEAERAEEYRKAARELAEEQDKRAREAAEAEKKAREKAAAEAKAAELEAKSRGKLEGDESVQGAIAAQAAASGEDSGGGSMLSSILSTSLRALVKKPLNSLSTSVKKLGKKITQPIINAGKKLGNKVTSTIKSTVSKITSPIKSMAKKASTAVKNTLKPAVDAIKKPFNKVASAVSKKILTPAKSLVSKVGQKVVKSRAWKAAKYLAKPKALGKFGKKLLAKMIPQLPKLAAKLGLAVAKQGAKSALKQIPIAGIVFGLGEAIYDLTKGDPIGAALATLAGVAPTLNLLVPGLGTAISMGAVAADVARDVFAPPMKEAVQMFDDSDPDKIENESDIDLSNSWPVQESVNTDEKLTDTPTDTNLDGNKPNGDTPDVTTPSQSPTQPIPTPYRPITTDTFNPLDVVTRNITAATAPPVPTKVNMKLSDAQKGRAAEAMGVLTDPMGLGLSKEQAAGMVGVLMAESKLNPQAYNKAEKHGTAKSRGIKHLPEEYGAGIAQWTYHSRKKPILNFINEKFGKRYREIEEATLPEQVAAVAWEMQTKRPKILAKLKGARSVAEATDIALRGYENGSANALASKEFIDKYTWAGGYQGSMYGPSNGRVHFAEAAYRAAGGNLFRTPGAEAIEEVTGQFVPLTLPEPTNSVRANLTSVSPSESTPSATPIVGTDVTTPKVSISTPDPNALAVAQSAPNVIKEGDYVGPTIREGDSNVSNVTYVNSNNELTAEVFG